MNIIKNDKVVLVNEFESLKVVGQMFEVANIVPGGSVILRDYRTKVAACAISVNDIDKYFKKLDDVFGWTKWTRIADPMGDMIAEYRTNQKKVEVRIPNDMLDDNIGSNGRVIRSTATCSQGDEFNLSFGIQLAYMRCERKYLKMRNKYHINKSNDCKARLAENKNITSKMIASLN